MSNKVSMIYDILAIDRASAVFSKITDKVQQSSLATKALQTAAGALAFGAVAKQTYSFVQAASDVNEALNLNQRIFGESSEKMDEWAKTGAEAFGLSRTQTLEAANQIGNALINLGFDMDEVEGKTQTLVSLAGDLASAFNTEVPDALFALQAGLRGEVEPLRRFGIFLDQIAIKQEAMNKGVYDGIGPIDRYAKAVGVLGVVQADTSTIQGDFAATSSGLANSQRILAANVANLKSSMGEGLLPVFEQGVGIMTDVVKVANALPAPVKTGAISFTLLTSAAFAALPIIASVKDAMDKLNVSSAGLAKGGLAATIALLTVLAGIDLAKQTSEIKANAEAVDGLAESVQGYYDAAEAAETYADAYDDLIARNRKGYEDILDAFGASDQANRETGWEKWFGTKEEWAEAFDWGGKIEDMALGISDAWNRLWGDPTAAERADKANARIRTFESAVGTAAHAAGLTKNEVMGLEGAHEALNMDLENSRIWLGYLADEEAKARGGTEEMADETWELAESFATALREGSGLLQLMDDLAGNTANAASAEEDYLDTVQGITDAIKEKSFSLDKDTEAGRKGRDMLRELRDDTVLWMEAAGSAGATEEEVNAIRDQGIAKIEELADKYGIAEGDVWDYVKSIEEIPPEAGTLLNLDDDEALARLANYKTKLAEINRTVVMARVGLKAQASTGSFYITGPDGQKERWNWGMAAQGGLIEGPGGPKDDKIPMLLSDGEYVVPAEAVDKIGVDMMHKIAQGFVPTVPTVYPVGVGEGGGRPTSVTVMLDREVLVSALTSASRDGITVNVG